MCSAQPQPIASPKFSLSTPQFMALQPDIVELISKICGDARFCSEVEFTCYDSFDQYFANNFHELNGRIAKQLWELDSNGSFDSRDSNNVSRYNLQRRLVDEMYFGMEKQCLTMVVSLISVCGKYVYGNRWLRNDVDFHNFQMLHRSVSVQHGDVSVLEYKILKNLRFVGFHRWKMVNRFFKNSGDFFCRRFRIRPPSVSWNCMDIKQLRNFPSIGIISMRFA